MRLIGSKKDDGLASEIEETVLPAIGVRHDFETVSGRRVGLITNHSGRRKLLVYDERDPDACSVSLDLSDTDARNLTEVLGAPHVIQKFSDLQQAVSGLTIDWLELPKGSEFSGATIGDTCMRTRTGASIVAVRKSDGTVEPSPGPELQISAGDTLVLVGTPEGTMKAAEILGIA